MTHKITRRAALSGIADTAALAPVASAAAATALPALADAKSGAASLIALEAELLARERALNATPDDILDPEAEEIYALDRRIVETPAMSLEDVAVKLRRAWQYLRDEPGSFEEAAVRTALDGVARIATGGAS
jgi:hypothetical protein